MLDKHFLPQVLLIENDIPTIELYQRELAKSYQIIPCHDEESILSLPITLRDLLDTLVQDPVEHN
jgi:hypothetical protein